MTRIGPKSAVQPQDTQAVPACPAAALSERSGSVVPVKTPRSVLTKSMHRSAEPSPSYRPLRPAIFLRAVAGRAVDLVVGDSVRRATAMRVTARVPGPAGATEVIHAEQEP